ncbi:hypothetical protein VPH35_002293 [Triticum aestivum]
MTDEEEAHLMARVMEDSMYTHDERQWEGLEEMMAHSAVGEMAAGVGVNWCPTPPRSPEREASPREEVVQAPPAIQTAPVYHAPPAHLWTPPAYVDLVSDDDDTGGQ